MPQPIKASTISEESAEPEVVDYPVDGSEQRPLPAETTTAPDITDTGFIWDESYPGDTQPMPTPARPKVQANRVTEVSDSIIFGHSMLAANTAPFILIPAHRDRLRVTIQVVVVVGDAVVYLSSRSDLSAGNGWQVVTSDPITFDTRDEIYAVTGPVGANATRVQWAIELVAEGCGCA